MSLETAMRETCDQFPRNGTFSLVAGQSIKEAVKNNDVPNARGVYLIFRTSEPKKPVYIGKAGTLRQNGTWKNQGIAKRLTMKQDDVNREQFFKEYMDRRSIHELVFRWFVTHEEDKGLIPALVEVTLLQAHYEQFRCLPDLNRCV